MKFTISILLSSMCLGLNAQNIEYTLHDFHLYGNATMRDDTTIMLTDNLLQQTGVMWYNDDIDLRKPFHIELDLFFGCSDGGADGICFILHPEWALGSSGEGIGVGDLKPSFGVEMDTYQNFHLADAHFDHTALMANGASHHKRGLTETIPLRPKKENVENCTFYHASFDWNPKSQIFTFTFNDIERIRRKIDLVPLIFKGNPFVFWGLGAATAQKRNKQLVRVRQLEFTRSETLTLEDQAALIRGEPYILPQIIFSPGSSKLPESAKPLLDKLMRFHRKYPEHTLIIDGFTDSKGEDSNNITTSKDRAETIAQYMIAKGLDKFKVIYNGHGKANPIDTNKTENGRKNNRRIEVRMKVVRA